MVSVNYNPASATAIRVLQSTNRELAQTQQRLTTGLKVSSASDNPTAWAAAQSLRSEISEKTTLRDAMSSTAGKAKVAATGLEAAAGLLGEMKALLIKAKDPSITTAAKAELQKGVGEIQKALKSVVSEAQVNGESWLDGSKTSASVLTSYGNGANAATTMEIDLSKSALTKAAAGSTPAAGILDKAGTASSTAVLSFDVTSGNIDNMLTDLDTALTATQSAAATVGSSAKYIAMHDDFLKKIGSIMEEALGSLVNADMEEETAKLAALQVKQQLASQMLSMANDSQRNILMLFQ